MAHARESLERRLEEERKNLRLIEEKIAEYTKLEAPISLLKQRDKTREHIAQIEEQLRHIPSEPPSPAPPPVSTLPIAGCVVAVVLIAGALIVLSILVVGRFPIIDRYLAWLRPPTPTSTPTKTPVIVWSPTITHTPTLTLVPTPTPTPTPYYVEIVVDASERMSDAFEGGTTKMESAWQTARDIARIRAQQGQFVTVRLFGGQDSLGSGSCLTSYSLFDFTNDSPQIIGYLTDSSAPGGEAAVVTALLDASDELQTHENIGREIILLTGGEDGCGSTLSVFYNSENQALWTQTFVVLFADEEFGPFIDLEARGANINYNLVSNRAEAETVGEEIAHSSPPTPTPMPSSFSPSPPTTTTGGRPQPTSTPKPPPPPPTGGVATATHTPKPAATPLSTPTSTATSTSPPPPTDAPKATFTPTTSAPTPTFTSIPTPYVLFTNLESGQGVQTDFVCGFVLQGQAQGGMNVKVTVHTDGPYEQGLASIQGDGAWELNIYLGGRCDYQLDHTVIAELLDAEEQVVATYQVEHVERTVECNTPLKLEFATVCKVDAQYQGEDVIYLREEDYQCFVNPINLMVTAQNYDQGGGTIPSVAIGDLAATSMYTRTQCILSMRYQLRQQLGIDEGEMSIWPVTDRPRHCVWLTPLQ